MPMRLQEVHPSVVHFPLTLFPVSIVADSLGRATGNRSLLDAGKWGMALTAVTAAVSGFFGLVAQEEVKLRGRAGDMLVTHRNLNVGFTALATTMALRRSTRSRPSLRYLAAGAAATGVALYSAYLGGKMVYEHGVGVAAADGIADGHGPELTSDRAGDVARHALDDARVGLKHAGEAILRGEFVPALRETEAAGPEAPPIVPPAGEPRAAD